MRLFQELGLVRYIYQHLLRDRPIIEVTKMLLSDTINMNAMNCLGAGKLCVFYKFIPIFSSDESDNRLRGKSITVLKIAT